MKPITFSLLAVLLVLAGAGCERHPAGELEEGEAPKPSERAEKFEEPAAKVLEATPTPTSKPDEAKPAGPAPKFFPDAAK